jgi:F-type H+-transporting ATPase subunit b
MLELDIPTIVFEILNFLLLSVLLYFLLFRRVMERVRARAEEKERIMQEIKDERQQAAQTREEIEQRLGDIDHEISTIVAEAQESMERERRNIIQSARDEAKRILNEARSEADQLHHKALDDFRQEVLETISEISGYILRNIAPDEVHNQLVENLNERIWEMGRQEMPRVEAIRRSLDERSPTITVESARELTADQQRELARTLSALIDRDIDLDITLDPDLILGLQMRVGDTIINNSIASELQEIQHEAYQVLNDRLTNE